MAEFERYSAVEMFGVPVDNPDAAKIAGWGLIDLMQQYGVEAQPVPEGLTDITPYYGKMANSSYMLSYSEPAQLATVEIMPRAKNTRITELDAASNSFAETQLRTIRIPTDQDMFALVGRGPRFGDLLCVHEVIAYRR